MAMTIGSSWLLCIKATENKIILPKARSSVNEEIENNVAELFGNSAFYSSGENGNDGAGS